MIVLIFLYTNSTFLHITKTTRTRILLFLINFSLAHFTRKIYKVNKVGHWPTASLLFSIFHKVTCMKKYVDYTWLLIVEK